MKKVLFIAMVLLGLTANAQKTGFNVGGDLTYNFDIETIGLMAEANYLFEISDEFRVGPALSYQYNFGKTIEEAGFEFEVEGSGDLTIAGAAQYDVSEQFVVGLDLGYYLDASTLYYRPVVGYKVQENLMAQLSLPSNRYSNSIAIGVVFGL